MADPFVKFEEKYDVVAVDYLVGNTTLQFAVPHHAEQSIDTPQYK